MSTRNARDIQRGTSQGTKTRVVRRGGTKEPDFEDTETKPEPNPKIAVAERRRELKTVADKISGHPLHHGNWHFEGCIKMFPQDPEMRSVDCYYPYALKGPLYIDEVDSDDDYRIKQCKEKAESMKLKGYRYAYITEKMKVQDVAMQMGEV